MKCIAIITFFLVMNDNSAKKFTHHTDYFNAKSTLARLTEYNSVMNLKQKGIKYIADINVKMFDKPFTCGDKKYK